MAYLDDDLTHAKQNVDSMLIGAGKFKKLISCLNVKYNVQSELILHPMLKYIH